MKSNRRGGLGRGLGALIPTAAPAESVAGGTATALATPPATTDAPTNGATAEPVEQLAPVPGARFAEISVTSIVPNPKQPRQVFDEEAIEELKTSIQEVGFLQPIVVRELPTPVEAEGDEGTQKKYELVMGERRWRAAQALGKEVIPAIVRETRDDAMLRDALLENIHRANLNPLEEAAAYQQLLEEFGATHEELARRIGRSRPQISNTIRLLNLPAQVQRRVAAGVLSAGHARALLGLDSSEEQETLAHRIVAEGLSVRATEEMVSLAVSEGGTAKKAAPQRRAKPHAPALSDLADRLSDRFDTRVKVDIGQRKGRITIEFATVDDLERIVGIIGVDQRGQREQ
ncbi:ParB/RepB/Spo0J family partition protein [Dactylosporangium aurantiacum]|uniref:ParB/RepB/Spo0J family partition protein n=1 Tax=Dactylosporangium aurantiacum TaxID=35754 RepID=A0A9Q9IHA7_9ACTN|nr:ParB/RepB/Spo0J family partition protein [Dactylosporangium aurantiacum]MDG6101261.1 ParB/RepB/Spo0J family partition protein [Dactylosporangium aurantiacum]UWZ54723.1 ParB/RepB/Spo0J family partition protein [Dactylosporangium aurantiacum]